jgi:hypothetical protein
MRLVLLVALLLMAGCEPRQPLTRVEVVGIADSLLRTNGLAWSDPVEVIEPPMQPDPDGRRWWQLRYEPRADRTGDRTAPYVIIVDDATSWARFPTDSYVVRRPPLRTGEPPPATPALVREGTRIMLLTEPAEITPERTGELTREAARLNGMAAATGLHPLFSVRRDRNGRSALIYGWQGDRGMAEDAAVRDWLHARTAYDAARWIDLDAAR